MRVPCGVAIPQVFTEGPVDLALVRRYLERAESRGFDSAWVQETIVGTFSILEPVTLLSYAAAVTSRLRLGTSVLLTTLRNPVQLAKALSTLDQLSEGRLIVGIAAGGHVPETIFGYGTEHRMRRFNEGIEAMKALWEEPEATVHGSFVDFEKISMEPKPVQRPLPLWFGARRAPALRRAVRYGHGWMGAGSSTTEDFVEQYEILQRELESAGRDPSDFAVSKRIYLAVDDDAARAEGRLRAWFGARYGNADMASRVAVFGTPEHCTEELARVVEAGARHLLLNTVFDDLEQLDRLTEEVLPALG